MQAASEIYGVPEVPPAFTNEMGAAGRASVSQAFNLPHDMWTHSSSSTSRALAHPGQSSPSSLQHPLQVQHLQQPACPSQPHAAERQQAQQPPVQSAGAHRPQPIPQQPQAHQHNFQNDSLHQQVRVMQQLPTGSDSPKTPSKASEENNKDFAAVAINQSLAVEDTDGLAEEAEKGSCGNRWPREETLALLKLRSDMDARFRDTNLKGPLWKEVSRKLAEMGYHRNAKKCKEKFENVQKYYKRTKDGKAGRQAGKTYRFFSQLEALHGKTPGNVAAVEAIAEGTQNEGRVAAPPETGPTSAHGDHQTAVPFPATRCYEMLVSKAVPAPRPESDYSSGLNVSSASSDDEYESENPDNRKRKRKSPRQLCLAFFKNLVNELLSKQERMQQTLLDALERRESDRMIREEAWKRQEMARLTRDQELRAQERNMAARRDTALLAFLQRMTGQSLEIPSASASIAILAEGGAQPVLGSNTGATPNMLVQVPGEDQNQINDRDPNGKRWPKPEVQLLIKLRSELQPKFLEPGPKGLLWKEISDRMAKMGFSRSAKRCKEKWENINKYFKKAKQSNRKRPENAKTCPYFHELDSLYRKGVLKSLPLTSGPHEQLTLPHSMLANGDLDSDQARDVQHVGVLPPQETAPAVAASPSIAIAADAAIDIISTADPQPSENFNRGTIFPLISDDRILPSTSPSAPPTNHSTHRQPAQDESAIKDMSAPPPHSDDQQLAVTKAGDEEKMELSEDETADQTQSSSSI